MTGHWGVYRHGGRWGRGRGRAWLVLRSGGWDVVEFDGPVLELLSESRIRSDPRFCGLGQDVLGESFEFERFLARVRSDDPARPVGTRCSISAWWQASETFGRRRSASRPASIPGGRCAP
jgi:endonuclease VIII